MPQSIGARKTRMLQAYEAAQCEIKPNLSKIAREFGVPYRTLYGRVYQQRLARTAKTPMNKALDEY